MRCECGGDQASVRFDALPGERFSAPVTQLASLAASTTGTLDVELSLERRAESLASGLIGGAEIIVRDEGRVTVVPLEAIVEASGDSASVFVVAEGATTASRRQVRLGRIVGDRAAVSTDCNRVSWSSYAAPHTSTSAHR